MTKTRLIAVVLFAAVACGPLGGCQEPELSYAEAVRIYNSELETLERLQAQRAALAVQLEPSTSEVLGGLLGEATKRAGELRGELRGTLEDLDDPASNAGQLADPSLSEEALGDLSVKLELEAGGAKGQRTEIEAQIAKLDAEIAAQQVRVERAKADRDAAEARR